MSEDIRFCVCGHKWDRSKPEAREHDHDGRMRESLIGSSMAQVDYMVEEEAARRV